MIISSQIILRQCSLESLEKELSQFQVDLGA